VNAASKGHLPVVMYLLSKQAADPLVRNNWGETAYDVAASVFEVWICEILQKAEAERWRGTTASYNPLRVHTTVPLVLYENQRLDTRLKTLAVSGGRPKFSASGLGARGRPAPFELKLPSPDENTGAKLVASWRSDVQLPLASDPYVLPNASRRDTPILEGAERSHFWLSEWHIDDTHPRVSPDGGWQYAQSFSAADEAWLPEPPSQLVRLLSGTGLVTAGLASPSRNHGHGGSSSSSSSVPSHTNTWVRRRRWVRVMRRRLFPPLPFMEPDGAMHDLAHDGSLIPHASDGERQEGDEEGQELGPMRPNRLSSAQDYVARARYLVGNRSESNDEARSPVETRRAIAKLERATSELRQGILSDDDRERKIQAEVLLNAYTRELERCRLSAGAQGLLNSGSDDEFDDGGDGDDDDDHDEVFRYPGYRDSPLTIHTPPVRSGSTEPSSRPPIARDLTPDLSQAPEFRVPTREAPQKMTLLPHAQWERDDTVQACNDCQRRFGFILRRHCRRCGRIFCDRCSCHRVPLEPSEIVQDPTSPVTTAGSSSQRVCQSCFDQRNASTPARASSAVERIVVDRGRLMAPGQLTRQNSSSQLSDLADCPVCGTNLSAFEGPADQEAHVKSCLDGGTRSAPQTVKYLVYELPAESALVGVECVICLEEFTRGSVVARLSCFCSFHNACLSSWLQRGRSCPVHTR
ncbi:FYVE-domain-containing protein, partial [Imleria badia]